MGQFPFSAPALFLLCSAFGAPQQAGPPPVELDPGRAAALEAYQASGEADRRVAPEDHPMHLRGPGVPYGLGLCDGVLYGIGPGYTARFEAGGFELRPRGRHAASGGALAFVLEDIGRGSELVYQRASGVGAPEQDGFTASFALTPTIDARFAVGAQGIEQSFLFHELPGTEGDLVVRGRLVTELERRALPAGADGLVFGGRPGQAEDQRVRYGGVTGIDATGRRAGGTLRLQGDQLELRLPGEFLEDAVAPILLDPLVGPMDQDLPTGPTYEPEDPAVAFDTTNQRYLAVWTEKVYGGGTAIYGQFRSPTGSAVGGLLPIVFGESAPGWAELANVNATDKFLVVYRSGGLYARTVDAASGVVSSRALVSSSGGFVDHDVGGEALPPYDRALVAYIVSYDHAVPTHVSYRRVSCPESGPPVVDSLTHLPGGTQLVSRVAVTKSGGNPGVWLVGWTRELGSQQEIRGALVNYGGWYTTTRTLLGPSSMMDYPAVAGDGSNFAAAGTDYDGIHARSFYGSVSSAGIQPWSSQVTVHDDGVWHQGVELERVGGYNVIAWRDLEYSGGVTTSRIEGCKLWVSTCNRAEPIYTMSEFVGGQTHSRWRIFSEKSAAPQPATPTKAMLIDSTRGLIGQAYDVYFSILGV